MRGCYDRNGNRPKNDAVSSTKFVPIVRNLPIAKDDVISHSQ